jgi:hypothetical protein
MERTEDPVPDVEIQAIVALQIGMVQIMMCYGILPTEVPMAGKLRGKKFEAAVTGGIYN